MRYQLDKTMEFRLSGNVLNCANNMLLNPLQFIITSRMTDIRTGDVYIVKCNKNEELVEFVLPADSLPAGTYEWRVYLRNELVSWNTPKTTVEVS